VTARSKLPQKKWMGLALPIKRERNSRKTVSTLTRIRQKAIGVLAVVRRMTFVQIEANRTRDFDGMGQTFTSMPSECSASMSFE